MVMVAGRRQHCRFGREGGSKLPQTMSLVGPSERWSQSSTPEEGETKLRGSAALCLKKRTCHMHAI